METTTKGMTTTKIHLIDLMGTISLISHQKDSLSTF